MVTRSFVLLVVVVIDLLVIIEVVGFDANLDFGKLDRGCYCCGSSSCS